jgi:hypothetical protein
MGINEAKGLAGSSGAEFYAKPAFGDECIETYCRKIRIETKICNGPIGGSKCDCKS